MNLRSVFLAAWILLAVPIWASTLSTLEEFMKSNQEVLDSLLKKVEEKQTLDENEQKALEKTTNNFKEALKNSEIKAKENIMNAIALVQGKQNKEALSELIKAYSQSPSTDQKPLLELAERLVEVAQISEEDVSTALEEKEATELTKSMIETLKKVSTKKTDQKASNEDPVTSNVQQQKEEVKEKEGSTSSQVENKDEPKQDSNLQQQKEEPKSQVKETDKPVLVNSRNQNPSKEMTVPIKEKIEHPNPKKIKSVEQPIPIAIRQQPKKHKAKPKGTVDELFNLKALNKLYKSIKDIMEWDLMDDGTRSSLIDDIEEGLHSFYSGNKIDFNNLNQWKAMPPNLWIIESLYNELEQHLSGLALICGSAIEHKDPAADYACQEQMIELSTLFKLPEGLSKIASVHVPEATIAKIKAKFESFNRKFHKVMAKRQIVLDVSQAHDYVATATRLTPTDITGIAAPGGGAKPDVTGQLKPILITGAAGTAATQDPLIKKLNDLISQKAEVLTALTEEELQKICERETPCITLLNALNTKSLGENKDKVTGGICKGKATSKALGKLPDGEVKKMVDEMCHPSSNMKWIIVGVSVAAVVIATGLGIFFYMRSRG